jgi:hypothetical protein
VDEEAPKKKYIKRGSFLQQKPRTDEVYISERQEWVRIREITLRDFDMIDFHTTGADGKRSADEFRARLILAGVINEEGKQIFQEEDIQAINDLPASIARELAEAISRLSRANSGALEEEIKN